MSCDRETKITSSILKPIDDIRKLQHAIEEEVIRLKARLEGIDCILRSGKYAGRKCQIREVFRFNTEVRLHIGIYRLDNKVGFKGKESFIDDHTEEYVSLSSVCFNLNFKPTKKKDFVL